MHPNVISWGGMGFLAYAFEENAVTAMDYVKRDGLEAFRKCVGKIASCLYQKSKTTPVNPRDELVKWCNLDATRQRGIDARAFEHPFELTAALIHGDLHLRNVFVKDGSPTLIDFARSDFGPIAIDFAKLAIDALIFCYPEKIGSGTLHLAQLKQSLPGLLEEFEGYLSSKDDKKFLELALRAYANVYLTYPDVRQEVRLRLQNALVDVE